MDPDLLLSAIAAVAGFLLKSSLAFAACAVLSRLVLSPKLKFVLWSAFVYGTAAYWLYLASVLFGPAHPASTTVALAARPAGSTVAVWPVPPSWAFALSLALRMASVAYVVGLGYSIFVHLKKRRYLSWVLRFTSQPTLEVAETFKSIAAELHATRSRLLILSGTTTPVTFGWFRPIVLLPDACLEEDGSELQDILRHELYHVHRWDAAWNELAVAARGLLFFHPAIWFAVRQMQFNRELACDLAVVAQSPARRAAYAECLVRFAKLNVAPQTAGWGIDFAASAHQLTVRVHSILAVSRTFPRWNRYLRVASGLTITALFFGLAPSLAVLLSYAHSPVTQLSLAPAAGQPSKRAQKKVHQLVSSVKSNSRVETPNPGEVPEDQPEANGQSDNPTQAQATGDSSGPQLHRRGDPSLTGNKATPSQTIALNDPDAKGDSPRSVDSKQAIQQTATAALGIYKRVASVDRH